MSASQSDADTHYPHRLGFLFGSGQRSHVGLRECLVADPFDHHRHRKIGTLRLLLEVVTRKIKTAVQTRLFLFYVVAACSVTF